MCKVGWSVLCQRAGVESSEVCRSAVEVGWGQVGQGHASLAMLLLQLCTVLYNLALNLQNKKYALCTAVVSNFSTLIN